MKILLDMNLTPKWRIPLVEAGHDVVHWSEIGAPDAPDTTLMEWARQNDHIIFTNDLDYGALLYVTGATSPSVLQARSDDVRPAALSDSILRSLASAEEELKKGALVTVDLQRHRVSILPLRRKS